MTEVDLSFSFRDDFTQRAKEARDWASNASLLILSLAILLGCACFRADQGRGPWTLWQLAPTGMQAASYEAEP